MMDALGAGAEQLGLSMDRFCREIAFLSHGTTVGTNTIIQKRGAKVGLITTKGHEDAIHIMRGSRGYGGRDIRKVVHFPETSKPAPIVPKRLIRGVSERVDCFGEIVVSLNETEAEAAIRSLLAEGVQAIAICFLWSFRNPAHEQRVRSLVENISKDVFVTCSVDIAPKWGEYERVTATALNAYLGPVMSGYLQKLDFSLKDLGYRHGLQITQCGGGTVPVGRAGEAPCSRSTPARCPASPRRCSLAPRWARKTSSPPTWAAPRSTSRSSTTASRPTRSSATPTSTSTSCPRSTCRRSARAAAAWCASSPRRAP